MWVALASLALVATLALAGCSPLTAYNSLAPADRDALLARSDVAYGDLPRQRLDVYVPSGPKASTPGPIVVVFYGGSWNSGSKSDYAFLGKALASRGFVTVVADYRLVPEISFPAFLEDCAKATLWAHRHARDFGADPKRLFVMGHSAGAYNAAMIALDGRYLQALGSNVSIIRGVAALAGPYDFLPLDVDSTKEAFGRAGDLTRTQPISFVTSAAPAMFLATGADDTIVYPRNTVALAERLKRVGVPVTVRSYPGISHVGIMLALSVPFRANAPVLEDVAAFISARR
jgi:acetyl esterase/lipase